MLKQCPKCGAELPEESSFCLKCFSFVGNNVHETPVTPTYKEKTAKRLKAKMKNSKGGKYNVFVTRAGAVVATLVIFAVAVAFSDKPQINAYAAVETTLVPVTDEAGEPVTDENGEEVYETVTIAVQSEEKGFFAKIIDTIENKTENKSDIKSEQDKTVSSEAGSSQPTGSTSADMKGRTAADSSKDDTSPSEINAEDDSLTKDSDFQWDVYKGKARLVKYIGNASTVTVPAQHDGNDVGYIGDNAFSDNAGIKKIVFEDSQTALTLQEDSGTPNAKFNNLPNLTEIVFPSKTETYTKIISAAYFSHIFSSCPSLKSVNFQSKTVSNGYCYSQDGTVYALCGSRVYMMFYPCGKNASSFTLPDDCIGLAPEAIQNNPYIVSFTGGSKYGTDFECSEYNFNKCTKLNSISVSPQNESKKYFCVDGVLYMNKISVSDSYGYNNERMCCLIYPAGKTQESYTFPSGTKLKFDENSFCSNPYIKTVYFPEGARVSSNWRQGTGISVVYLKDCDDSRKISGSSDFKGITVSYY